MKGFILIIVLISLVYANILVDVELARLKAFKGKEVFYDINQIPIQLLKEIAFKAGGTLYSAEYHQERLSKVWIQHTGACSTILPSEIQQIEMHNYMPILRENVARTDLTENKLSMLLLSLPCQVISGLPVPQFNTKPSIIIY